VTTTRQPVGAPPSAAGVVLGGVVLGGVVVGGPASPDGTPVAGPASAAASGSTARKSCPQTSQKRPVRAAEHSGQDSLGAGVTASPAGAAEAPPVAPAAPSIGAPHSSQ
jgi:hypothetical protein